MIIYYYSRISYVYSRNFRFKIKMSKFDIAIANFVKKAGFDNKLKDITSNKNELNADLDKYKYTGYGIGFDSRSELLYADGFLYFWS